MSEMRIAEAKPRPALFLAAAGVMAAWVAAGTALWLRQGGGPGGAISRTWSAWTSDWMTILFLTDMAVLALLCLLWMCADMGRRGVPVGRRVLWVAATAVIGSPVLLLYLARRGRGERPGSP